MSCIINTQDILFFKLKIGIDILLNDYNTLKHDKLKMKSIYN